MKRVLRFGGVFLVLFIAAACGDGAEALTRAEFQERANDICDTSNERLADVRSEFYEDGPGFDADDDEAREFFEDDVIPDLGRRLDDIDRLRPPDDIADNVESVLDRADSDIERFRERVDEDPASALTLGGSLFADSDEEFKDLGLDQCASDAVPDDEGDDAESGDGEDEGDAREPAGRDECVIDTRTLLTAYEAFYASHGNYTTDVPDNAVVGLLDSNDLIGETALVREGFLSEKSGLHDAELVDADPAAGSVVAELDITVQDPDCGVPGETVGSGGNR